MCPFWARSRSFRASAKGATAAGRPYSHLDVDRLPGSGLVAFVDLHTYGQLITGGWAHLASQLVNRWRPPNLP